MESVIDITINSRIKSNLNNLDNLINSLEDLKSNKNKPSAAKDNIDKINKTTVDNYKILKKLDKAFSQSESKLDSIQFNYDVNLNKAIATYLLRLGWFDVFKEHCDVYNISFDQAYIDKLLSLNAVLSDLRSNNLESALDWANSHRDNLDALNSPLLFYLHRSKFLQQATSIESLTYFKEHISPYLSSKQFSSQASSLLASLAFRDLANSPYAYLASEDIHQKLLSPTFEEYWCTVSHVPKIDHLEASLDVGGGRALPILSRFNQLIQKTRTEWSQSNELPVEIPLDDKYKFHSVFTCPISKEQTSESNPPMMLTCGHVVANESLSKLSKGGGRVKCPYCPIESQSSLALRVYF
ncbi:hypothetical protein E3Q16_03237 [Wallemia mellicola]|nr:hypothetical protein E3Q16_03237 [Wallemia mellicola]TIC22463.1 hypothetical protein E3Q12_02678 [Wallemia mellicola]